MPTSVERGFLKLDSWDNPWEQRQLTQAFLKIDDVITGLENPDLNGAAFLKYEHSPSVRNTVNTIGDAFITLGDELGGIANVALKIDEFVVKLTTSAAGSVTTAASVDIGDPQTDFLKLDAALATSAGDLKYFGADFLKLDQSSSRADFDHKLSTLETAADTVSKDMLGDGSVFNALGADFLRLAGDGTTQTDQIYKNFGGDLQAIGGDFNALGSGFGKLDQALSNLGSGGGRSTDSPTVAGAFGALNSEFLKLSADLQAAAAPAVGVIRADIFGGGGGSGFDGRIFADIFGGGGGSGFDGRIFGDVFGGGGGSGRVG